VKTLAKCLIAFAVLLVALAVFVGPGGVVAGAEYPFGIGPWSSTGHYCRTIDETARFVDHWKHSDRFTLTASQKVTWHAIEKTLTETGPQVPRADFTAFFRSTGNPSKTMQGESALINTWWNQNCTDPMMEAPASIAHSFSGIGSHATFAHYPKNVLQVKDFFKVNNGIPGNT